jgi:hypothetical protein
MVQAQRGPERGLGLVPAVEQGTLAAADPCAV